MCCELASSSSRSTFNSCCQPMTLRLYPPPTPPPNWSLHDLTMPNAPPSQRATVPLLITTSYEAALLSADTGPCGTPAAADGEVNQIICPPQITGGLQLTRLRASNARKSWSKMIYIRTFASRLHKSRRYYKTLPKNCIHLGFLIYVVSEKIFPIICSRVQKNNTHLASGMSSSWPIIQQEVGDQQLPKQINSQQGMKNGRNFEKNNLKRF